MILLVYTLAGLSIVIVIKLNSQQLKEKAFHKQLTTKQITSWQLQNYTATGRHRYRYPL